MTASHLTPRQADLLNFIRAYVGQNQRFPMLKEMAAALGCHFTNASHLLGPLVAKGFLIRNGWRRYELAPPKCCPNCGHNLEAA